MCPVSQTSVNPFVESRGTTVHLLKSGSKPIKDRAPRKKLKLAEELITFGESASDQQREASNDMPDADMFQDVTSKTKFGTRTRRQNPDYQTKP